MLAELLVYATSPCPASHRRLGYLKVAVDLWSRAGRCRAAWKTHEERCRAVVERVAGALPRRRKALVIGSGLLRDVPVSRLADLFEAVILVDVVHLSPVRLATLRLRNLRFVTLDVTGTADWLVGAAEGLADPLAAFAADPDIDLVISANVLSQLPLGPEDAFAAGRTKRPVDEDLGRRIIDGHVAALARFPGRVVLLTDRRMRVVDRAGRTTETLDLLRGHGLPAPPERWDWTLAPYGEDGPGHALVHEAGAYPDFGPVAAGFHPAIAAAPAS